MLRAHTMLDALFRHALRLLPVAVLAAPILSSLSACSSDAASTSSAPSEPSTQLPTETGEGDAGATADAGATPSACAPVRTKTSCKRGGEGAILRGVVTFDPAAIGTAPAPALALFLRHAFVLKPEESAIGGRLHGYDRITLSAAHKQSGRIPFEMDLCSNGIAMWSEENGGFNVVAILDVDGSHDISRAASEYPWQTPKAGELAKILSGVEISCRGVSPCVELALDCRDGTACTTITPLESTECRLPACGSDSSFCRGEKTH